MSQPSSKDFLLGRLHSLAGILPLGLFLLEHLYSNAVAMLGPQAYDKQVSTLQGIPFLPVAEVLLIAIPLLYHAVYGIRLAMLAKNNPTRYSYAPNWMFVLQRISGIITLIFVIYHLWVFRFAKLLFDTPINFEAVHTHLENPLIFAFYVLGVVSTTFHFANGVWSGLITWGITTGKKAQQISSVVRYVLFVVLSAVGIGSLLSFV